MLDYLTKIAEAVLKGDEKLVAQTVDEALAAGIAAKEILDKAIDNDQTEHAMYPFIEKFKSIKRAVEEYGRI